MAKGTKKGKLGENVIAVNRKARHDFTIEETFEAGLALEGWEVKALRAGRAQIQEAYVLVHHGEAYLLGGLINPLPTASTHVVADPQRTRKLLLHKDELKKLIGATEQKGYTVVPLQLHWKRGKAKLDIGLAKGKKKHDKRADIKERDWERERARLLKEKNR
ncbi:MAG: SsrA-binding protein SmpB [Pseudomonadota bacterium]